MAEGQKRTQTIQQIMVTHSISFDKLVLVAGVEPARVHLFLLGYYTRKRHAERVLQALSILSGELWTRENVEGIRIYRQYTEPFMMPYEMFAERNHSAFKK